MKFDTGVKRLYQHVARQLAEVIHSGEYPPGSRLPAERKLAERFNVSRPTIREAIIALELSGHVTVKGGSGVYVTDGQHNFNDDETDLDAGPFEILEARMMIEGEAAALAARLINDEELEELRQALADMEKENAEPGRLTAEVADERFHKIVARATRNDVMINICEMLWALRNQSRLSVNVMEKVRMAGEKPRIEEHRAILQALVDHDSEAARNAMRDHLGRVVKQLLDATEMEAVEEARRQVLSDRERFSLVS